MPDGPVFDSAVDSPARRRPSGLIVRVLLLYAHPVETSFQAALHRAVVASLREGGHEVDDCDLYAEGFNPVLSRQERLDYHDTEINRGHVEPYVRRLLDAEALVLVHPVWNYGYPAILKGFFDRVFLPGVSFTLRDGRTWPTLQNIHKLASVVTYGGSRFRALMMGDPPRKHAKRVLRLTIRPGAPVWYLAQYDLNRANDATCAGFLDRVSRTMRSF